MTTPRPFSVLALAAAWILPGAGHIARGQTARGLLAGAGVLGLFTSGLLIGGITVIDQRQNPLWFFGQSLVGPVALAVNHIHQTRFKGLEPSEVRYRGLDALRNPNPGETIRRGPIEYTVRDANGSRRISEIRPLLVPANPGETPPVIRSIGKVNEIGTLYTCLAGFINLVVIIDAAYATPRSRRRPAAAPTPSPAQTPAQGSPA